LATRAKPLSPDWLLTSARISSLSLAGLARRSAPGAGLEPPQIFVKRRFRQCRCTSICQVRPAHADHARSRAGTGPRKRRPAGIRRNTGRLYGGAISCRRRFSTDTILSASGNRRKRFGRRSKDLFCFGAAGSFQGGRERHPFKIAPDRRPDSPELRPTSRWSAAFAAESRVEVRRPDAQDVAQIVSSRSPRSPCAKTAIRRPQAPRHQVRSS
jgi:hypothetical protein